MRFGEKAFWILTKFFVAHQDRFFIRVAQLLQTDLINGSWEKIVELKSYFLLVFITKNKIYPGMDVTCCKLAFQSLPHFEDKLLGSRGFSDISGEKYIVHDDFILFNSEAPLATVDQELPV